MSSYEYKTISFIIPTIGRESLKDTLASVEAWPGDEVLAIQHDPPSGNYGQAEKQEDTDKAKCDYLAFIDDDDVYVTGHRKIMAQALEENVDNNPVLFKMQYPSGHILWDAPELRCGNVGLPMILIPNIKDRLPKWGWQRFQDFRFIDGWQWPRRKIVWRPEVIALLGHDDDRYLKIWKNRLHQDKN